MSFSLIYIATLFIPGIMLVDFLGRKFRLNVTIFEKIIFGSLLWNYFFIVPSILLGLFTHLLAIYFRFFNFISVIMIIFLVIDVLKNRRVKIEIKTGKYPNLIITSLSLFFLLILCILGIRFHSIFIEWDAISYYLPSSKAILLNHGLDYNPYRSLTFFDSSPAIPIMYCYITNTNPSDIGRLYLLTLVFFVLTLLSLFLVARKLFSDYGALISILLFMALPTVIITLSSRSLYLDIPFMLYLLVAMYAHLRMITSVESGNNLSLFEYAVITAGSVLAFFVRMEFLLPLILTLFLSLIYISRPKNYEIIAVIITFSLSTVSFGFRELRKIITGTLALSDFLLRLIVVLVISMVIFAVLKSTSIYSHKKNLFNKQHIVLILAISFPAVLYLLTNVVIHGFIITGWTLWNRDMIDSIQFFVKIVLPTPVYSVDVLRFDRLLWVWWLVPIFLIPTIIAVYRLIMTLLKKEKMSSFSVVTSLFFIGLLFLWSLLYCDVQPRRLYYFAPFIALIVTHGLFTIKKFFNPLGFALRVPTYITSITTYTLAKIGVKTINDISLLYAKLYQPNTDIELTVVSALIFLIIFTPYENLINKIKKNITLSPKTSNATVVLTFSLNAILITSSISPILIDAISNGQQSIHEYYGGWLHYPEVVNYYNENITDPFVTIGFYCHELITFANRSTIDLSDPIYGMPIYSIITTANETEMLNKMKELNIKYFLEPKQGNPFFSIYEKLVNSTVLGNILVDNPQLRFLATFKYATLYTFHENYTLTQLIPTTITPWNYNPETNYTLTTEQNTTKFTATTSTGGRISLMYTFAQPLTINEALWLTVKNYNQSKLVVILFTSLQNRTTDYFFYQCPLTNQTRKPVINLKQGTTKGNFNLNRIEGILIGIETQPNTTQTIEIHQLNAVTYND